MSSELAIKVTNLSKCYQIYDQPRDRLKQFVMPRLQQFIGRASSQYFREFWALKNVSFEVKKGETVGVIGRNGAGKSTLLQILCGTLSQSNGGLEVNGRVAALLELGSGFNTEFTGRENIYMNAGILGLTEKEIDERFDDIVAFADIGQFLDQPVKTYSSGMYVRLAFSVVVHVDADILIVDEALSVGDMYFQAKCMAHMKRLIESGVTVLFVSHDIGAVKALCNRAVYLEQGEVVLTGTTDVVAEAYYSRGVMAAQPLIEVKENLSAQVQRDDSFIRAEQLKFTSRARYQRIQNGMAELLNVQLFSQDFQCLELIDFGQFVTLKITFKASIDLPLLGLAYHIRDKNGTDVVYSDTGIEDCHISSISAGEIAVMDWTFKVELREGDYTVAIMLSIPQDLSIGKVEVCDFVPIATNFQVSKAASLPLYGYVHWPNEISIHRFSTSNGGVS